MGRPISALGLCGLLSISKLQHCEQPT